MIKFDSFIHSINDAILSAHDLLDDKNLEILDRYFESSGSEKSVRQPVDRLTKALTAAEKALSRLSLHELFEELLTRFREEVEDEELSSSVTHGIEILYDVLGGEVLKTMPQLHRIFMSVRKIYEASESKEISRKALRWARSNLDRDLDHLSISGLIHYIIERFLEAGIDDESEEIVTQALHTLGDVLGDEPFKNTRQFRELIASLRNVTGALDQGGFPSKQAAENVLRPRMVTVQYPHQTKEGKTTTSDVHVPLITMVPLSMSQISEVKFRTDLEVQLDNNELSVSFPTTLSTANNRDDGRQSAETARPVAQIEITMTPHHTSEGLRKIIEGYEKVLRSQIPH